MAACCVRPVLHSGPWTLQFGGKAADPLHPGRLVPTGYGPLTDDRARINSDTATAHGGLLVIESMVLGLTSPYTLLHEVEANLNVILMVIFMAPYFSC